MINSCGLTLQYFKTLIKISVLALKTFRINISKVSLSFFKITPTLRYLFVMAKFKIKKNEAP